MKVSGAHIEEISAWTNMGYESAEKIRIQTTVEKLAKEGKHVINIIHGNKTMVGGDYAKTITFLWEADDEDPTYAEYAKQEREKAEKKQKEEQKKKDIEEKIKQLTISFGKLQSRITQAEELKGKTDSFDKLLLKERLKQVGIGIGMIFGGVGLAILSYYAEITLFVILGVLVALGSIAFFYQAFSASGVAELHCNIALGQADISNLSSLKSERDRIQKEIKTLKEELNNL